MKPLKYFLKKHHFILSCAFTMIFLCFISAVYYRHATTFSFVDEYTNMLAGYFMNQGRDLYTDIFFHHMFLISYGSALLQQFTHPESLYSLIRDHRLVVITFAFVFNIILMVRFRYIGMGFTLFFEPLKYFLFGNLFLAESFIVYPLVYLLGLVYESFTKKKIGLFETLISGLFTWFIIFMREPYVPLGILMYLLVLWKNVERKKALYSLIVFFALSFMTFVSIPLKDFIFQVITVNATYVVPAEVNTNGKLVSLFISFFYPVTIFFDKTWNFYRVALLAIDILFLSLVGYLLCKKQKRELLFLLFLVLGLANIRWVSSDTIFYIAYHAIVWFGMFAFTTFILLHELFLKNKTLARKMLFLAIAIFIGVMSYPNSYLWEKFNREKNFTQNYGKYYSLGNVIHILSDKNDTVFIHGWDSLIYWQAAKESAYPYVMYYPVTSLIPEYAKAREQMFANTPPQFYYVTYEKCEKKVDSLLPINQKTLYAAIHFDNKPTCLFIQKTKIPELTSSQLEELAKLGFTIQN